VTVKTRLSRLGDSAIIHEVIATAGWGITRECVQVVQTLDPEGYTLGVDDLGGPIGVGFGLGFHRSAWIGHLVVRPENRGQGLGGCLFQQLLTRVKNLGKWPIYLTATEMGAPLYAKFGFVEDGTLTRWEIPASGIAVTGNRKGCFEDFDIRNLENEDMQEVAEFDALRFGDYRGELLELFHRMYPERALICRRRDGEVAGYALGGTLGLGPIVAEAEAVGPLFAKVLRLPFQASPQTFTFLDTNVVAQELCMEAGLMPTRRWLRMKLGDGCEPQDHQIFNMSVAHG